MWSCPPQLRVRCSGCALMFYVPQDRVSQGFAPRDQQTLFRGHAPATLEAQTVAPRPWTQGLVVRSEIQSKVGRQSGLASICLDPADNAHQDRIHILDPNRVQRTTTMLCTCRMYCVHIRIALLALQSRLRASSAPIPSPQLLLELLGSR